MVLWGAVLAGLALTAPTVRAQQDEGADTPHFEAGLNPLFLPLGALSAEAQWYVTPGMALGLYVFSWEPPLVDNVSVQILQPYLGVYSADFDDAWFGRLGQILMTVQSGPITGELQATSLGGGYRWLWPGGFSLHLGWEFAFGGSVRLAGREYSPNSFNMGILRMGHTF